VGVFLHGVAGIGLAGTACKACFCDRACCCIATVLYFINAFSISRVTSLGKTGRVSIDSGTGCFHVFNRPSIAFLVGMSMRV
jgi:hypothetical protein